jgi:S1-C subfamily serine protease
LVVDDRYDDRIVVWKVMPRSPAFYAGFRPGDVVTTFRGQPVAQRQAFVESFTSLEPGMVDFEVRRGDRVRPLQVEVPGSANVGSANVGSADVERISERREQRIENRVNRRNDRKN